MPFPWKANDVFSINSQLWLLDCTDSLQMSHWLVHSSCDLCSDFSLRRQWHNLNIYQVTTFVTLTFTHPNCCNLQWQSIRQLKCCISMTEVNFHFCKTNKPTAVHNKCTTTMLQKSQVWIKWLSRLNVQTSCVDNFV